MLLFFVIALSVSPYCLSTPFFSFLLTLLPFTFTTSLSFPPSRFPLFTNLHLPLSSPFPHSSLALSLLLHSSSLSVGGVAFFRFEGIYTVRHCSGGWSGPVHGERHSSPPSAWMRETHTHRVRYSNSSLCACVCVSVYICVYVYVYECMCVHASICTCVCGSGCVRMKVEVREGGWCPVCLY